MGGDKLTKSQREAVRIIYRRGWVPLTGAKTSTEGINSSTAHALVDREIAYLWLGPTSGRRDVDWAIELLPASKQLIDLGFLLCSENESGTGKKQGGSDGE